MSDNTQVFLRPMQKDITATTLTPDTIFPYLDENIAGLLEQIQTQDFWKAVTDPDADPAFVQTYMREVYLEVYSYQPHMNEAILHIIAQMPRSLPERHLKAMIEHQVEEFAHSEIALRDYIALGGDEAYARHRRISPASFTVSGLWLMIAHMRDPFMYLGVMYLFEGLSPIVSGMIQMFLHEKGMDASTMEFIEHQLTEEIRHANLVRSLIKEIVEQYPEAAASISYGLDCALPLYPIPIWDAAYQRAKAQFKPTPPSTI